MPVSFRSRLKKLAHNGDIEQEEYQALLSKLDGHDKQIRADAIAEFKDLGKLYSEIREDAYKEFAEVIAMDIADCKTCPIGCKDNSYGECEKRLVQYVKAMRGEDKS